MAHHTSSRIQVCKRSKTIVLSGMVHVTFRELVPRLSAVYNFLRMPFDSSISYANDLLSRPLDYGRLLQDYKICKAIYTHTGVWIDEQKQNNRPFTCACASAAFMADAMIESRTCVLLSINEMLTTYGLTTRLWVTCCEYRH